MFDLAQTKNLSCVYTGNWRSGKDFLLNVDFVVVVVVWPPSQPRRAGWAAERAPGCFPPGTLCGVRVCVCV